MRLSSPFLSEKISSGEAAGRGQAAPLSASKGRKR